MHAKGISTPPARHKRRQPIIKGANMTLIYIIFPFYVFMSFYAFLYFLSFCGRQGCFPYSHVFLNYDYEIRPT